MQVLVTNAVCVLDPEEIRLAEEEMEKRNGDGHEVEVV